MTFYKIISRHSFLRISVLTIVISLAATACNTDVFHSESVHLKKDKWKAEDTLFYNFSSKDTLATYDFYFEIRNTTDYDMQNLYLFITAYYPGNTFSRDTAECILAAADGKWFGKGMGKHKDNRFLFRKGVRFRKPGNYSIAVNQAMRIDTLNGISDVGILIKKQAN
ncbi:MAG: gliding motility lipoprotein GldH [Bacteroidales bacterium]|nr:gliding motility lipoprotein GldH [Bacteroidales bacterium]